MPAYLAKITTAQGLVKPPIVTNCATEEEARRLLESRGDEGDQVEICGLVPTAMQLAFGNVAEGTAVFRYDWIWPSDGTDPRPY
jgi:hypothetical protein